MARLIYTTLLALILSGSSFAQSMKLHAHNDYHHDIPFWTALGHGFESIEVDVILKNDRLYVAHEPEELSERRTLESLYLKPLQLAIEQGFIKTKQLQLLIDIKSEAVPTLTKIIAAIDRFPTIKNDPRITFVISGDRPEYTAYANYPAHILFDYQKVDFPEDLPLEKVGLVSISFRKVSKWNGKGRLVDMELKRVQTAIEKSHRMGKPFRFWASPDSKTAWKALHELGVDYINTDMLASAAAYAAQYESSTYATPTSSEVYRPTFQSDGSAKPIKNIILLIGDGMGLAQLSAGMYANNKQLTITQLKKIGLVKTQAADDFTTDSAAGATAIATGEKTKNRHIGVNAEGRPLTSLTDHLHDSGYLSGVITTDHLTGATPSAFYAHEADRSHVRAISQDFVRSNISLGIGAAKGDFQYTDLGDVEMLGSLDEVIATDHDRVVFFPSTGGLSSVLEGRGDYLSKSVAASLEFFKKRKKPFFLLVEGAFIDSGGHANEIGTIIEETIDFDQAVAEALKFADQDQETLVIITADHETGGLALPHANLEKGEVTGSFHTDDHTGIMVPLFAYGPYSQHFAGVYENTAIFKKIVALLSN